MHQNTTGRVLSAQCTVGGSALTLKDATRLALLDEYTFTVERGPKVYDPVAGTLLNWVADPSKGFVPAGCPLIATWNDRVALGGASADPNVWYMSRRGDWHDFDYAARDTGRAVAGVTADAGRLGEPLTAFIVHQDDYFVFAGLRSMYVLRGDPGFGGQAAVAAVSDELRSETTSG